MREVLDRLREAETAIDHELGELYFGPDTGGRFKALNLLWKAKRNVWTATMHTLNAAAGLEPPDLD
ncbi:hypothetical protein ES703_42603 [subsurface metagenome]